ncbi:MAG: hypothetical protein ABI237_18150 [Ginsengibacter sp.]
MRNYFLIIAAALFISCNSNQQSIKLQEEQTQSDKCVSYPQIVDSLHLQDLYDSARWYIYTLQCDENYLPKSDTSKSISFGELPLAFDNLFIRHDTLDINFNFVDKQEPILNSMNRGNKSIVVGVGFNMKSKSKIYMSFDGGNVRSKGDPTSRYENPLQPEVIKYIKGNWDKLNECFRELAERKGINK